MIPYPLTIATIVRTSRTIGYKDIPGLLIVNQVEYLPKYIESLKGAPLQDGEKARERAHSNSQNGCMG